jgi:hypothetical protein
MFDRQRSTAGRVFDVADVQHDVEEVLLTMPSRPRPIDFAPPAIRASLEQPQITSDDLGRITADAIKTSHEAVAAAITSLGVELAENVRRIEILKTSSEATIKACLDAAEEYRAKGRADAERIETASRMNDEVRDAVDSMRKKIEQ